MRMLGNTYLLAVAQRRTGRDLTREKLVDTPKNMRDYRIGGVATPRKITKRHHIGNNLIRCLSSPTGAGSRWLGGRRGRVTHVLVLVVAGRSSSLKLPSA